MSQKNQIIFATSNPNKVLEVSEQLNLPQTIVLSLADIGYTVEIPETADTFEGNALQKSQHIYDLFKKNVFSEDTGLEVYALDMKPGVHTARYAGAGRDDNDNMDLLLNNLEGVEDRRARFKTVISLIYNGEKYFFTGIANGSIAHEKTGEMGFGYDPIFIPEGFDRSFATFSKEEKNKVSHRGQAVRKLISFLNQNIQE